VVADFAHGRHHIAAHGRGQAMDSLNHLCARYKGIVARVHGGGARVVALAGQVHVAPQQAHDAAGDADGLPLALQHRALFDVVLVVAVDRERATGGLAAVPDPLQLIA